MARKHDRSFRKAESEIAGALARAGRDRRAVVGAVADIVAGDIRGADRRGAALLTTISALAFAVAHAAVQAGGEMGCVAQGFLFGVTLAARFRERNLLAVIEHAAGTFVKHVHEAGGDPVAAGRGLVEGAGSRGAEFGLDAEAAADAAGRGAVEAADEVNDGLGRRMRTALKRPLAGDAVLSGTRPRSRNWRVYDS
jgi:hypothetical protein